MESDDSDDYYEENEEDAELFSLLDEPTFLQHANTDEDLRRAFTIPGNSCEGFDGSSMMEVERAESPEPNELLVIDYSDEA